jgi:uncharacterized protein (TIGR03435 family)
MKRSAIAAGLIVVGSWLAAAQEFEVVSIKPSDPGKFGSSMRDTAGQATYTGITVAMLVRGAYDLRDFQLVGGPAWISASRYNIAAKPPAGEPEFPANPVTATDEQRETFRQRRRAMVRAMLADRFQLKVHKEIRELPVYALTVAKSGTKLGGVKVSDPNLRPGMEMLREGSFTGIQIGVDSLVQALSRSMDRIILDQTGLKGKYDVNLKWTPEQSLGAATANGPIPADQDAPTIFTALQEQLGLKLESSKGPVEVIVIDHVERPSGN